MAACPGEGLAFSSSLEGNVRRAIDLRDGDVIDEAAFQTLVRVAADLNLSKPIKSARRRR